MHWVVSCCGPKVSNISVITDVNSPSRHTQKSSQHVRACATGDGAIFLKIEKLSHITGTAKIVELACAYGLHPRLWLLMLCYFIKFFVNRVLPFVKLNIDLEIGFLFFPFSSVEKKTMRRYIKQETSYLHSCNLVHQFDIPFQTAEKWCC